MTPIVLQETDKPRRREQQVRAHQCKACGSWDTIVYKTFKIVRYCICRRCENTWTQTPKEKS